MEKKEADRDVEDDVTRERARELAAEWGRKRGSGKKSKTHEKVVRVRAVELVSR